MISEVLPEVRVETQTWIVPKVTGCLEQHCQREEIKPRLNGRLEVWPRSHSHPRVQETLAMTLEASPKSEASKCRKSKKNSPSIQASALGVRLEILSKLQKTRTSYDLLPGSGGHPKREMGPQSARSH